MTNLLPLPSIAPGTVLDLAEADYCYGIGPLRVRVSEVLGRYRQGGETWLQVRGVAILWDGRDGGQVGVSVRASALCPPNGSGPTRSQRRPT